MRISTPACCFGILLMAAVTCPAFAERITVTNTNDDGTGSLRAAIEAASPGDTIVFDLTYPATIKLKTTLSIAQNLTIHGPGESKLTISGNDTVEVLSVNSGVTATLFGLTIAGGSALVTDGNGGGIYNSGSLTLTNVSVSGNLAGHGGGIYNSGKLTLTRTTISSNHVLYSGGGIFNTGALIVNFGTFSDYAEAYGGGIYNNGGTVTVSNSTFSENRTEDASGGAIANVQGDMTITNCTFSNNDAYGDGGAIANLETLTVSNSTFSDNLSDSGGGGISNSGTLTLINSTLYGNNALLGSGIINDGTLNIKNTLLAKNGYPGNCTEFEPAISGGYNLSDDTSCNFSGIGDKNNTPAGLDPRGLQNNGGPTQTIALLRTSPAVNAIPLSPINYCTLANGVTPVATDQRGVIRPQLQKCDIGAYEFATAYSLISTLRKRIDQSIPSTNGIVKLELEQASAQLFEALCPKNWAGSDGNHLNRNHAQKFFHEEETASWDLTLVLKDTHSQIPTQEVQTDLINLALANRLLATTAISDAAGGNPTLLSKASARLSAGDQATAVGDYNVAIDDYAEAWTLAESAKCM